MTGTALQINHHHILRRAPTRTARAFAGFACQSLQLENTAQGQPENARAADPQQIAAGHFEMRIAKIAASAASYLEHRVFGFDASLILKAISDKKLNLPEPNFHRQWPWLDEVAAARAARSAASKPEPANALAVPIFAAIDRLARPETDQEGQLLAIQLTRIALAMPGTGLLTESWL